MSFEAFPQSRQPEQAFRQGIERLVIGVDYGDFGDQTTVYDIQPNTRAAELASAATNGNPDTVYVNRLTYVNDEGVDQDFVVNLYEKMPQGALRTDFELIDGRLIKTTDAIGTNRNAIRLASLMEAEDAVDKQQEIQGLISKMLQEAQKDNEVSINATEDPQSFNAINELLEELAASQDK